jgi:hypothetical protein
MKVEVRFSKDKAFVLLENWSVVSAEKVFYEGKEVREDKDFDKVFKVEIVEEWGLKSEDSFLYEPSIYVYLWEDTDADDIKEEIALPSKPLWRRVKAKAVVVR